MSFWGLFVETAKRMEEEKAAEGRNIKNNQEENKMKYENELASGLGPESAMPVEDLTNMLRETRSMAREAGSLADKIGAHLFGRRDEKACRDEAKNADSTCFKEELDSVRRDLMKTIEDLAKICTLIGA